MTPARFATRRVRQSLAELEPNTGTGITDAGYNTQQRRPAPAMPATARAAAQFNCLRSNLKSGFLPGVRAK